MVKRITGWILFGISLWMFVSPQALMGLKQLKWMYRYAFPGEIFCAMFLLTLSVYILNVKTGNQEEVKRNG